ncbi:MAG: flagellar motor switch protein FliN [Fimbriimonadaceae bacterium]
MSTISPDLLNRLSATQNQIWQTVSLTVSEAANGPINFGSPLVVATPTADLYADMAAPQLCILFAFANAPENQTAILLSQETFGELACLIKDEEKVDIDENLVSEIRGPLEAIVQGICMAVGNLRNEAVVASGMNIRFTIFSFPPNMQVLDEIIRVQVAISADDLSGTATWLLDPTAVHLILGITEQREEEEGGSPFPEMGKAAGAGAGPSRAGAHDDQPGLELLMDIPLEISVELGRVKMLVKDVVDLGTGSIVEIDKAAGEPVDVMVNGRLVAKGEVVVIEDNFGVRVTEILTPQERLMRLGEVA